MEKEKKPQDRNTDEYTLKDIFQEMELDLIASYRRNLKRHAKEEIKEGFSWEMWQKAALRNIVQYRREVKNIIVSYSPKVESKIEEVLTNTYTNSHIRSDSNILLPQQNQTSLGTSPPNESQFFGVNRTKLDTMIKEMQESFQSAEGSVYRKAEDIYKKTIFNTSVPLAAGAVTLPQAIDKAASKFLNMGINCITYSDGKQMNIASYAEMALRTANQRATFLAEGQKRDETGQHLVMVSTHANTCEKCLPWQGQILIDDVFSHPTKEYIVSHSQYKLLSEAKEAGLLHPNCRHSIFTYIPGITGQPLIIDPVNALRVYNAEKKQRELENAIRKSKRRITGLMDSKNIQDEKQNLKSLRLQLRNHLAINPELRRNYFREKDLLGELTEKEKSDIMISEIKSIIKKPKSMVNIGSLELSDLESFAFDDKHINLEREHQVTKELALKWVREAKVSVTVWNGRFIRYYSKDGSVYVDVENKNIRTAFSKDEYTEEIIRLLEVLKNEE